ncbi:MAG: hypothetical protein L6R39_000044 [Caloplaca ligustica]|nr:MAG: hypothetical protein L6R39_000044 [Caloplaca ligustica]
MAENHQKARVIIHTDFTSYPADLLARLRGARGCVWALGVSQNDVTKKLYEEITVDYPSAAAKAFASLSDPFNFVYVSGEGATTTPGRLTPFFGRVKGQIESQLLKLSAEPGCAALRVYSLRPAGVDPKFHPEIHQWIPKLQPATKAYLLPPALAAIRTLSPAFISPTRELGQILVQLAMSDGEPLSGPGISGEGRTVSNAAMRRMAGL